jgi:SRSO17 transposase
MGHSLEECKGQNLHHMLTESPWEYGDLFKKIRQRCIRLLRKQKEKIYILIDEVGFRKKGKHSACVGQQYIGSIGKNDNGQVAVTGALSAGDFYCPVEMELFMPEDWQRDKIRREKAGIPEWKKHESKTVMALHMIRTLFKSLAQDLECVVFDALYGNCIDFIVHLKTKQIPFVGDIRENLNVFLNKPTWKVPKYSGRGRRSLKEKPSRMSIQVRDYMHSLKNSDYELLTIRNGTKGKLKARYHLRKVWVLHESTKAFVEMHLLIRKDIDGRTKYALGDFPGRTNIKRMAKAQAQRVFVERIFEEGKNIAGMEDYQVRSWNGFHRHVALSSLALLFIMEQKLLLKRTIKKITGYNIQELVNATIATLSTIDQIIQKVTSQIKRYQHEIKNQLKRVT